MAVTVTTNEAIFESERAVHMGAVDPFVKHLNAETDQLGRLADRIDPDGHLMAHFRRNGSYYASRPMQVLVVLRLWVQTGRLPDDPLVS